MSRLSLARCSNCRRRQRRPKPISTFIHSHSDQVVQTLKAQDARARALLDAAWRMAENTPVQLNAAQETLTRAKARYEFGLTNVIEVAEAQRLLAQAEIDDAVARLSVWH